MTPTSPPLEAPAKPMPAAFAALSPEWYAEQVASLEVDVQNKFAAWQQALGRLDALRQMQAISAMQPKTETP